MCALTVYQREPESSEEAALVSAAPSVLSYQRPSALAAARAERKTRSVTDVPDIVSLDQGSLPEVVLELPDLRITATARPRLWPKALRLPTSMRLPKSINWAQSAAWPKSAQKHANSFFASKWYWVTVVLGGSVAVALIATAKKPAPAPNTEAPPWSASSAPAATIESGYQASAPASQNALPVYVPASPQAGYGAPTDEAAIRARISGASVPVADPQARPADVRTARGESPRWDGGAPAVRPSEAAPLGINPSVP